MLQCLEWDCEPIRVMQHTGTCDITGFAHVPEAGALCVSDASGRLLMIDTETRAIEEVRRRLTQYDCVSQGRHLTGKASQPCSTTCKRQTSLARHQRLHATGWVSGWWGCGTAVGARRRDAVHHHLSWPDAADDEGIRLFLTVKPS